MRQLRLPEEFSNLSSILPDSAINTLLSKREKQYARLRNNCEDLSNELISTHQFNQSDINRFDEFSNLNNYTQQDRKKLDQTLASIQGKYGDEVASKFLKYRALKRALPQYRDQSQVARNHTKMKQLSDAVSTISQSWGETKLLAVFNGRTVAHDRFNKKRKQFGVATIISALTIYPVLLGNVFAAIAIASLAMILGGVTVYHQVKYNLAIKVNFLKQSSTDQSEQLLDNEIEEDISVALPKVSKNIYFDEWAALIKAKIKQSKPDEQAKLIQAIINVPHHLAADAHMQASYEALITGPDPKLLNALTQLPPAEQDLALQKLERFGCVLDGLSVISLPRFYDSGDSGNINSNAQGVLLLANQIINRTHEVTYDRDQAYKDNIQHRFKQFLAASNQSLGRGQFQNLTMQQLDAVAKLLVYCQSDQTQVSEATIDYHLQTLPEAIKTEFSNALLSGEAHQRHIAKKLQRIKHDEQSQITARPDASQPVTGDFRSTSRPDLEVARVSHTDKVTSEILRSNVPSDEVQEVPESGLGQPMRSEQKPVHWRVRALRAAAGSNLASGGRVSAIGAAASSDPTSEGPDSRGPGGGA